MAHMSNRSKTGVSEQIAVRMPLADLAQLDAQRGAASRADAVREAIRRWLADQAEPKQDSTK